MAGYALPDASEEAAIVSACRDGDREGFDALYRRYAPALRAYCRSRVRDHDRADDIAQEALIRVYEALPRFREGARFWSYLATVAANLCIDAHRREARLTNELPETPTVIDLDEQLELRERVRLVRDALPMIPDRYRTLLQLQSIDGWSLGEIADLEGLSISAVKTALSRARRALRNSITTLAEQRGTVPLSGLALLPSRGWFKRNFSSMLHKLRRYSVQPETAAALPVASQALASLLAAAVVGVLTVPSFHPTTATPLSMPLKTSPGAGQVDVKGSGDGTPTATGSLSGVVDRKTERLLFPTEGAQPENAAIQSITASPGYSIDKVLFASGVLAGACGRPICPVVFQSADGGATWQVLRANLFEGGTIILPPSYPADSRIFAAGPAGLQLSIDGGSSFATIVPIAGPTTISPAFSSGDPRILIGAAPTWEYRDDLGTARPVAAPFVSGGAVNFKFAPKYPADARLFAGGTTFGDGSTQASTVFVCNGSGTCEPRGVLKGVKGSPRLRLSPQLSADNTVYGIASERLFVSRDGASSFVGLASPAGLQDIALDKNFASSGIIYGASLGTKVAGGVFKSYDYGISWTRISEHEPLLARGAGGIFITATGRIIALIASGQDSNRGIACSIDGGITWARRCPVDA